MFSLISLVPWPPFSKESHLLPLLFQVYTYENRRSNITDQRFFDRVHWNGSKNTEDLQDGSIFILNVTFNDSGTYLCTFNRTLKYLNFEFQTSNNKTVVMRVVSRRKDGEQGGCCICPRGEEGPS